MEGIIEVQGKRKRTHPPTGAAAEELHRARKPARLRGVTR